MSTKSANHKLGQPGGVALCDKDEQVVGFRGALFGYFLGKQKVTKNVLINAKKVTVANLMRRSKLVTLRQAQGSACHLSPFGGLRAELVTSLPIRNAVSSITSFGNCFLGMEKLMSAMVCRGTRCT